MVIKAKYPKVGNELLGYQGIGSLHGGNQVSSVTNIESSRAIIKDNDSDWT